MEVWHFRRHIAVAMENIEISLEKRMMGYGKNRQLPLVGNGKHEDMINKAVIGRQ